MAGLCTIVSYNSISSKDPSKRKLKLLSQFESTAVEQVVARALVTQRARVRSPVGTSFLGEFFSGFFLTCKTNVRTL